MPRNAESRQRRARRRGYAVLRATGIVGILALATWTPAVGQEGAEARVTADRLNFREECGTSSPVLGVLTRDETVTVLGSELGTWIRVRSADGEGGCVSAQYLEIEPASTEPASTEVESMAAPMEDPDPYAWADLTDPDSAEIVEEIEELELRLATATDPDEQEDLSGEIVELESDLRNRHEELREERLGAAREAETTDLERQREATDGQVGDARRAERRAHLSEDWSGFHVGVNAGYGFGDDVSANNNLGTSPEGDIDGIDGGIQVGYDHQFNRFVLGVEGDYQVSGQSGSSDLGPIGFPGSSLEFEYDSFWTARLRAGFTAGRVLVYATAGYAQEEGEVRVEGPLGDTVSPREGSFDGFTAGLGAATMLADQVSLKGEVLHLEVGNDPGFEDTEFINARVGVNWHF